MTEITTILLAVDLADATEWRRHVTLAPGRLIVATAASRGAEARGREADQIVCTAAIYGHPAYNELYGAVLPCVHARRRAAADRPTTPEPARKTGGKISIKIEGDDAQTIAAAVVRRMQQAGGNL